MVLFCLIVAPAGSLLASALGIPLPFMLGSVGATMIAALLRWPVIVRYLGSDLPAIEAAFIRYAFGLGRG